jgi:hypothetical protein
MPYIVYGGVNYYMVRHAIQCKLCSDTLDSKHERDYKVCSCGKVAIDGGISDGNRIIGNPSDIKNVSMYRASIRGKTLWLPELLSTSLCP